MSFDKNNPGRKIFAIDLDGTLTKSVAWPGDPPPEPHLDRIAKVNELYAQGHVVIIYTARREIMRAETVAWLHKHGVHYHQLDLGTKLAADHYIDDKAVHADDYFNN